MMLISRGADPGRGVLPTCSTVRPEPPPFDRRWSGLPTRVRVVIVVGGFLLFLLLAGVVARL